MSCCNSGLALMEEYENALKFEAVAYARLIAHKRRHETIEDIPSVRHMQVVREAAERYSEGIIEAHGQVPSTKHKRGGELEP